MIKECISVLTVYRLLLRGTVHLPISPTTVLANPREPLNFSRKAAPAPRECTISNVTEAEMTEGDMTNQT